MLIIAGKIETIYKFYSSLTFKLFLGDTLYFVFQSDSTNTDWGWKFTVTGGQLGR